MSDQITSLPREIQEHILSYLRHADLIKVMLVRKSLRSIIEPLIWTHIELHPSEWHEHNPHQAAIMCLNHQPRNFIEPYYESASGTEQYRMNITYETYRAKGFLLAVSGEPPRTLHYMRSLCMNLNLDADDTELSQNVWLLFSRFTSLRMLDLTVAWPDAKQWDRLDEEFRNSDSPPPLIRLQDLRLRGYVPRAFARWLVLHSTSLANLELAILDRPISGSCTNDQINPPPVREHDQYPLEDLEDDGGPIPWATETSDASSDYESESDYDEEEAIAPRALSILDPSDDLDSLKNLSTLVLTRPTQSPQNLSEDGDWHSLTREVFCSVRSDQSILHEWARLIRAARPTLKHLLLDQRPVCEEIEMDCTESDEFMENYPYGPGFERFEKIVLPVLLEEATWPMLESISFYGFDVPKSSETDDQACVRRAGPIETFKTKRSFLPRVTERFGGSGVRVDTHLGRRMLFEDSDGVVTGDSEMGPGWALC